MQKSKIIKASDFDHFISTGQELAGFQLARKIAMPSAESEDLCTTVGNYVVRWKGLVLDAAKARKPG